jgi:hypothetical protein
VAARSELPPPIKLDCESVFTGKFCLENTERLPRTTQNFNSPRKPVNLFSRKLLAKTGGCLHPDPLCSNSSAQQRNELIPGKSSRILSRQEKVSPYEGN